MNISILNIGDELLSGKRLNTNAQDIARNLCPLGHYVSEALVIPDDLQIIEKHLTRILGAYNAPSSVANSNNPIVQELVIITGGLGPTRDDLTREAIARYMGVKLEMRPEPIAWIEEYLAKRGVQVNEQQLVQCVVPKGTEALRNHWGTACCFSFETNKKAVYVFPGVPGELRQMLLHYVIPKVNQALHRLEKMLWTWGLSESRQQALLESIKIPESIQFSSLPSERGVQISLTQLVTAEQKVKAESDLETLWTELRSRLPDECIIDESGLDLQACIASELQIRRNTVAVAESCTSGALGFLLTETPGSSRYFRGGILTYSNEIKTQFLSVDAQLLLAKGAVSEEVAVEMARGCLKTMEADYGCAITGIAGPDGGSADKPVGTIWLAVAGPDGVRSERLQLRGTRTENRWRAAFACLNLLRIEIQSEVIQATAKKNT